jgi:Na+/phosphate symporter
MHNKKHSKIDAVNAIEDNEKESTIETLLLKCKSGVTELFVFTPTIIESVFSGFINESRKVLKKQKMEADEINLKIKKQKDKLYKVISKIKLHSDETGHYYVQVVDYQRELSRSLTFITNPMLNYVNNNHKSIIEVQAAELDALSEQIKKFFKQLKEIVEFAQYEKLEAAIDQQNEILKLIDKCRKNQMKRIKQQEVGTRNSMLYLNVMAELRNVLLYSVNIVKAQRDFVKYSVIVK